MQRTVALALLLIAGCAANQELRPGAQSPANVTKSVNLSGFPPEFRRGFTDGCAAARAWVTPAKPNAEGQYAVGWQDGFDYCKPRTPGTH